MAEAAPGPAAGGEGQAAPTAPTEGRAAGEQKGEQKGGQKGLEQGKAAAPGRVIKPIPPTGGSDATKRANLLGFQPNKREGGPGEVEPEKDDFPALSKLRGRKSVKIEVPEPPAGAPKEGDAAAGRDPATGRFVAPTAPTPKPGEQPAAKPQEGKLDPSLLVDKDGKPVSEQSYRSLQGMFAAKEAVIRRTTEERDTGYRTAHAWREVAEKREKELEAANARLEQYERGITPNSGSASPGQQTSGGAPAQAGGIPDAKSVLAEVDTESFEALAKTAGLSSAAKYLTSEILGVVLGKVVPALRAEQAASIQPFQAKEKEALMAEHSEQVVEQVAALRDLSGNVVFPELTNAGVQEEIGRTWVQTGMPPEMAMTPQGLMAAVAVYRLVKGLPGAPSQTETASLIQAAQAASPAQAGARPASAIAASLSGDESGGAPAGPRSKHSPATQRLINALSRTQLVDPDLGFARNKPGR